MKKKDIQSQIKVCKRRINELNDAIEGKVCISYVIMEPMVAEYISPSHWFKPTHDEVMDPETRWLAMMSDMARTLLTLHSLEADLAAMESRVNSRPLPMIPFFDDEVAEDERSFVACYVEWRCM